MYFQLFLFFIYQFIIIRSWLLFFICRFIIIQSWLLFFICRFIIIRSWLLFLYSQCYELLYVADTHFIISCSPFVSFPHSLFYKFSLNHFQRALQITMFPEATLLFPIPFLQVLMLVASHVSNINIQSMLQIPLQMI